MKEIKYRAWYPLKKKMFIVRAIDFLSGQACSSASLNLEDETWIFIHTLKLMQYFDLKDKNGKEIYDSDYVKFKIPKSLTVVYKKDIQLIKFPDDFLWVQTQHNEIEVIGNLYENPKLIKGGK